MTKRGLRVALGLICLLCVAAVVPAEAREKKKPVTAKDQTAFGVEMASRGLWSEALFRFEQAQRLDPGNAQILNNIAVAHEALGLFEQALSSYRAALKLDPQNRNMRRNYSRFVEFYQSFKGEEKVDDEAPEDDAEGDTP